MKQVQVLSDDGLYDETLSKKLFHEVKLICWVFTHPQNLNKSLYIRSNWGKRCNKLLFMSHDEDPVLGTVKLPVGSGRKYLWNKTIAAYHYVRTVSGKDVFSAGNLNFQAYEHLLDEGDWFMRLDEDK
jgi:glycoprotein-N-acetylgalactosamine 3-beta-galactosyltransferase